MGRNIGMLGRSQKSRTMLAECKQVCGLVQLPRKSKKPDIHSAAAVPRGGLPLLYAGCEPFAPSMPASPVALTTAIRTFGVYVLRGVNWVSPPSAEANWLACGEQRLTSPNILA